MERIALKTINSCVRDCPWKTSAGRGFVQCRQGDSLDADIYNFFLGKNFYFMKFIECLHGQEREGVSQCKQGGRETRWERLKDFVLKSV